MGRFARIVIPGCPHHVTQRGNHRRTVFFSDSDREFYLQLLERHFSPQAIQMEGYCLMPNHVHQALIPPAPDSLARGVGRLHNDFARWQHMRQNLTGHFWQNRFFSCPMDEDHFWEALRYIELNPVRAGLVKNAWDWPWSSAQAHVNGEDNTGLLSVNLWSKRFNGAQWKEFLQEGTETEEELRQIRRSTRTGRPLGSEEFILRLEKLTGRKLLRQKTGPKPRGGSVASE
jgi:putative transposase